MFIIFTFIRLAILITAAATSVWYLDSRFGMWNTLAIWTTVAAAACAFAAILLRTSSIGKITWRNHVAGIILPFGYIIGSGRLLAITSISWFVWTLIAIATLLTLHSDRSTDDRKLVHSLLLISWIIASGGLLYLVGILFKNFSMNSRNSMSLIRIIVILIAMIASSIILLLNHRPIAALSVVGGPIAVVGFGYGLFVAAMITFGRKTNWH